MTRERKRQFVEYQCLYKLCFATSVVGMELLKYIILCNLGKHQGYIIIRATVGNQHREQTFPKCFTFLLDFSVQLQAVNHVAERFAKISVKGGMLSFI